MLKGTLAVITGASAGIGRATALALVREGMAVALMARREDRLHDVMNEIKTAGGRSVAVVGDATKQADIERLLSAARDFSVDLGRAGSIDAVVVNAGRGLAGGLLSSDEKQWREMYEVNVLGAAMLMRRAGAIMVQQGHGHIVALGSVAGVHVSPYSGFYGSTKFALAGMVEGFRREVCGKGVRVTLLEPGIVASEVQEVAGYTADNFYKSVERFGKLLQPADVAEAVVFILSRPANVHVSELMIRPTGQDYP